VDPVVVVPRPWRSAGSRIGKPQHAVLRHEGTLDDDVLAASAGEAADKPIVDNLVIAFRQQKEGAFIGRLLPRGRDHRAELAPLREITAARERPLAGESIATLDRDRRPGRRKAGKR